MSTLSLNSIRLPLLVERHDYDSSAVSPDYLCLPDEFILTFLERN